MSRDLVPTIQGGYGQIGKGPKEGNEELENLPHEARLNALSLFALRLSREQRSGRVSIAGGFQDAFGQGAG